MLKSGLESSGVRFIHDLRCSLHALHDCLLQFLCVRYSLGVSGDYGVTGSPLTPASQASVHVGPADYVLCVIVLFMLGVNTLEFADVYSVIEILCRFFITIFWCLRITSMCLLIHWSFRQYTHPPCVYPTKPTDPFEWISQRSYLGIVPAGNSSWSPGEKLNTCLSVERDGGDKYCRYELRFYIRRRLYSECRRPSCAEPRAVPRGGGTAGLQPHQTPKPEIKKIQIL